MWSSGRWKGRSGNLQDNGRDSRNNSSLFSSQVGRGPLSPNRQPPGPRVPVLPGGSSLVGHSQSESTRLYAHIPLAAAPQFPANFASEKTLETRMPPQHQYSHSEYAGHSQGKHDEGFCLIKPEDSSNGTTETRTWDAQTELNGDQLLETAPGAKKFLKIMQDLFGGTEMSTKETQTNKSSDQQTEPCWANFDMYERKVSSVAATESRNQATQTDRSSDEPMDTDGQKEDYLSGTKIRSKRSILSKDQGTQTDTFTDDLIEYDRNPARRLSGTTVLHGGNNANDFQKTKDKKIRDPATQRKIDELNSELENLMDLDSSHTPAFVELLINHVKLHRNVILSSKLHQETTGQSVTESAASEPVPNMKAAPNKDREDAKWRCESQPKVSTQNRAPMSLGPARSSQSSNSWTPSVGRVFPLQTYVVGQAFGSEQQFLNQIEKQLERWEIYLQKEAFSPTPNRLLLLFCPVMSRAGTDISHALEKIPAQVRVILVVMNHVPIENSTVYLDSRGQVQRSTVIHTVDCRFSQRSGLYSTEINTEAVRSVAQKIKQEATLPSIKN